MAELILHPHTKLLLQSYIRDPAHAILLSGEVGVGLRTIAHDIASAITDAAHVIVVTADEGKTGISIASVRELYALTKTKHDKPSVIVIDDADTMKHEAQNALLKLLEEPTANTYFILTSHYPQLLLATIRSRCQTIAVRPVAPEDSQRFVAQLNIKDETKSRQVSFIAQGRPAEIYRLVQDDDYFLVQSKKATDARSFLAASTYERLTLITAYSAREEALAFLIMLGRFAVFTLFRQPDTDAAKRLAAIEQAIERINGNGHVRSHLTHLIMEWA